MMFVSRTRWPKNCPVNEDDRDNLRMLLEQSSKSEIVTTLLDTLEAADETELYSLQCLLRPLLDTFDPTIHCVRCHKEYFASENGPNKCQIPHSDKRGRLRKSNNDLWVGFKCCGRTFNEHSKICISRRHTTEEEDVVYYGDPPMDMRSEHYATNTNKMVVRCHDRGCDVE